MSGFQLTCQYCGNSWHIQYRPHNAVRCSICNDPIITIKNLSSDKVDYYAGSPEFEKKITLDDWNP